MFYFRLSVFYDAFTIITIFKTCKCHMHSVSECAYVSKECISRRCFKIPSFNDIGSKHSESLKSRKKS